MWMQIVSIKLLVALCTNICVQQNSLDKKWNTPWVFVFVRNGRIIDKEFIE